MRQHARITAVFLVALLVVSIVAPAFAATPRIYINKGVKAARLGMKDTTAAKKIGKVKKKIRDDDYAGQTTWVRYFGKKSHGKYALEMYSNKDHKVIAFIVNGSSYKTTRGVHVGTTVKTLKSKYPKYKKRSEGGGDSTYYTQSGSRHTEFFVHAGKVKTISIWKL
jgi:Zn-dependent alcohol dehydrogenase